MPFVYSYKINNSYYEIELNENKKFVVWFSDGGLYKKISDELDNITKARLFCMYDILKQIVSDEIEYLQWLIEPMNNLSEPLIVDIKIQIQKLKEVKEFANRGNQVQED